MADSKLKKLEEQMTCSVCLGMYNQPKTLPCLHSYCKSCLEGINVVRNAVNDNPIIVCPQCRARTPLPQIGGVEGFVNSHHISSLMELHSYLTRISNSSQIICDACKIKENVVTRRCKDCHQFFCQACSDSHIKEDSFVNHRLTKLSDLKGFDAYLFPTQHNGNTCSTHKGHPCGIFCEDCSEIICKECCNESHKGHHSEMISDSYHRHSQMLEAALNPITAGIRNAESIISGERETEIRDQADTLKKEIDSMAEGMIANVRQSEEQLKRNVETVVDHKLKTITEQKRAAQAALKRLHDCEALVKEALKNNPSEESVAALKAMINRVVEEIDIKEFEPKEEADVKLVKDTKALESVRHIGDLVFYSPSLLNECQIQVYMDDLNRTEDSVSFTFSIKHSSSSLVAIPISLLRGFILPASFSNIPRLTSFITNTSHPAIYRVIVSPAMRGDCRAGAYIGNRMLAPVPLVVPFNPFLDATNPLHVLDDFNRPNGVIVHNNGHIIVTENSGSCVTILNQARIKVMTINQEECGVEFIHPRGLAFVSDECFLVLDDHRVRKMNMEGNCLASVGTYGTINPLEFSYPGGISVSPNTGNVWITDYCNNRVHVLHSDLTFSFMIGEEGTGEGQFDGPTSVVIDKTGIVFIVDCNNHRIQKFTEEGRFVGQFGNEGSSPGQLCNPVRIIFDNNKKNLYITERGNHRISIFTTDGDFVKCFGEFGTERNQFNAPFGIEFDGDGYLYICDLQNGRVLIY